MPLNRRQAVLAALGSLALPAAAAPSHGRARSAAGGYARHDAAQAFARATAAEQGLPLRWLQQQLGQARRVEAVRRLIMPPPAGTPKNWAAYRARFIEPQRIAAGAEFGRRHARWLGAAEARWGVPPSIVLGIIGVETFYGRIMGRFRVLDALATLAFDFPSGRSDRSGFFAAELAEFFVLCAREGLAPTAPRGSYAGAIGLPQFMPGSINRLALDFDGDGHVRLHDSAADAIGSVAHYLAHHGWQREMATHFGVTPPADAAARAALLAPDIRPSFSAAQMAAHGAVLDEEGRAHDGPLALVRLENGDAEPSHLAATRNFWVVTRYNWSAYYAMAVIELAAAVREALG